MPGGYEHFGSYPPGYQSSKSRIAATLRESPAVMADSIAGKSSCWPSTSRRRKPDAGAMWMAYQARLVLHQKTVSAVGHGTLKISGADHNCRLYAPIYRCPAAAAIACVGSLSTSDLHAALPDELTGGRGEQPSHLAKIRLERKRACCAAVPTTRTSSV